MHVCHLNLMNAMQKYGSGMGFEAFEKMIYGAYKMLYQMEYLAVDLTAKPSFPSPFLSGSALDVLQKALRPLGRHQTSMYYELPLNSTSAAGRSKSEDERLMACEEGEKLIREMAANMAPALKEGAKGARRLSCVCKGDPGKYPHAQ